MRRTKDYTTIFMKASLKYNFALITVAVLTLLSWLGGVLDGISWNFNYFNSRIDNEILAGIVGVFVNLAIATLFYRASKKKSKATYAFAGFMAALSIMVSIESADEKERKDEFAAYQSTQPRMSYADSVIMAEATAYYLEARVVLNRGNRTRQVLARVDSAGAVLLRQQARIDSIARAGKEQVAKAYDDTFPFIDWAGGLLLFGGTIIFSIVAGESSLALAEEKKVALRRAENERERIEGEKVINGWPHRIRSARDKDAAKELMFEYFVENGLQKGCIPADVTEAYKVHNINRTDIFNIRKEVENAGVNVRQPGNVFAKVEVPTNGHANTINS